ncbi:MAG: hypothetical protein VYC34_02895, partial [Planctomycetota bacterium]|nr:hypothetical protein [Planctomycetota bacterium]
MIREATPIGSARRHRAAPAALLAACLIALLAPQARAQLQESQVLILFNSQNAESQAVRDLYVAAHPGVVEFDINDTAVQPGNIVRNDYLTKIRDPLRAFLNTTGPNPLSQQIVAIVTTRGLPARIRALGSGTDEFQLYSTYASLESELTLLQQNLEGPGAGVFAFNYSGAIDNPYHRLLGQPIGNFDRSQIETQRGFLFNPAGAWFINGLTPGDFYLVTRLDSAPGASTTALEEIEALINRSMNLSVIRCDVQAFFDEYPSAAGCNQLDDDSFGPAFPGGDDFGNTTDLLINEGFNATHDETFEFFEGPEIPDQSHPILILGTYGENHRLNNCGENPAGAGVYVQTYSNIHPAAVFHSIESFNGNSIIDGTIR